MEIDIEKNRKRFIETFRNTERDGNDIVINTLDSLGFFEAPASARHHLAEPGGLVQHSLNVLEQARGIWDIQIQKNPCDRLRVGLNSIIVVSLLHDVCKANVYRDIEKFRKDKDGKWEKYMAYEYDPSDFPLGHGEKSVIMIQKIGFRLYDDEIAAIRWHMAGWDLSEYKEARSSFSEACSKYPLLPILIAADELATRITESL